MLLRLVQQTDLLKQPLAYRSCDLDRRRDWQIAVLWRAILAEFLLPASTQRLIELDESKQLIPLRLRQS